MLETLPQQVNGALEIRMGGIKLLASVPKKKKMVPPKEKCSVE